MLPVTLRPYHPGLTRFLVPRNDTVGLTRFILSPGGGVYD